MLVLRRSRGRWVTLTHVESGQTIRVGVGHVRSDGVVDLVFDDDRHAFSVWREERGRKPQGEGAKEER